MGKKKGKEKQRTEEAARRQTMWSYLTENFRGLTATDIYGRKDFFFFFFFFLLLSRLANVASRSAICQTRLKICTVGSPVIIAEAYRWREKRITVRESGGIKTDGGGEIGRREKRSLAEIWKEEERKRIESRTGLS